MVKPLIHKYDKQGRPLDSHGKVIARLLPRGRGPVQASQDEEAQREAAEYRAQHEAQEQEAFERMQNKTSAGMGLKPHRPKPRHRPVVEELKAIKGLLSNQ